MCGDSMKISKRECDKEFSKHNLIPSDGCESCKYFNVCPFITQNRANASVERRLKFLEFLWNTINPNDMERYWQMFNSQDTKTE